MEKDGTEGAKGRYHSCPPALSETPTWPVGAHPEEALLALFHISFLATYSGHCENSK